MEYENRIVDYFSGSDACLGLVNKYVKGRLQITGRTGRTERVAEKQVIVFHGTGSQSRDLDVVQEAIEAAVGEIDVELLWEQLLTENLEEIRDFSELYFGDASPVHISAMTRVIAADPVHFKRVGFRFEPRTAEEAEEIAELQRKRAEKAAAREVTAHWLEEVLNRPANALVDVPAEMEDFLRQTHDFLLVGHNSEAVQLLSLARKNKTHREVAFELLSRTGRLPAGADPFLLINGIHAGFSHAVLEAAAQLPAYVAGSDRVDYTGLLTFSIDDAETLEIDDALSVSQDGEETVVGIHIADPAHFVRKGDPVDRAAEERPLSLYLPTTTVMMFPDAVGCRCASLQVEGPRPSLSFMVRFAADGTLKSWDFHGATVAVSHRLTYEEADRIIAGTDGVPLKSELSCLLHLADLLRSERLRNGGFNLSRPEIKVRVHGDDISVTRCESDTPSHRLVSELMVLANRLTAEYALSNDIPIIYRIQDTPAQPVVTIDHYDPIHFQDQVRKLKRTRLSTHPEPHTGLGLDLYTQVSSPLRRYADLVIQRQLDAHFRGLPLPYELQELLEVLGNVERTSSQNRNLERDACKRWLLEYLKRQKSDRIFEATVVYRAGAQIFAELDDVLERGILLGAGPVRLGDRLRVRIRDVEPKKMRLALERIP